MKLWENPFYVLKLPVDATRRKIVVAAEELSFFLGEAECLKAQNGLLNPDERLSAEFNWFIDLNAESISSIRKQIEERAPIPSEGLRSLSGLNAAVYNFSLSDGNDRALLVKEIVNMARQYADLDVIAIEDAINQNRPAVKMQPVYQDDVKGAIAKRANEITEIISERLQSLDLQEHTALITEIAEKNLVAYDYFDNVILSSIVDQYEVRIHYEIEQLVGSLNVNKDKLELALFNFFKDRQVSSIVYNVRKCIKLLRPLLLGPYAVGVKSEIVELSLNRIDEIIKYMGVEKLYSVEAIQLLNEIRNVLPESPVREEWVKKYDDLMLDVRLHSATNSMNKNYSNLMFTRSQDAALKFVRAANQMNAAFKQLSNKKDNILIQEQIKKARASIVDMVNTATNNLLQTGHMDLAIFIVSSVTKEFNDIPEIHSALKTRARNLISKQEKEKAIGRLKMGIMLGILAVVLLVLIATS